MCVCVRERWKSIPGWLQRGPPARRSGCVHPSDPHTGLWCASSPERGGRKGNEERRGKERKGEKQNEKKLIPHSNQPSVDSTLLTSARLIAPQLTGLVTAVAGPTEAKHQLWPPVSVAMTSPPQWGGRGQLSPVATAADTVTQQPDQHQCLFCLKVGHSLRQTDRQTDRQTVTAWGWTERE